MDCIEPSKKKRLPLHTRIRILKRFNDRILPGPKIIPNYTQLLTRRRICVLVGSSRFRCRRIRLNTENKFLPRKMAERGGPKTQVSRSHPVAGRKIFTNYPC